MDTNVFLAIIGGSKKEGSQYTMAVQILEDIKFGKIQGVISPLMLAEIRSALRKQLSRNKSKLKQFTNEEKIQYINKESETSYEEILSIILELSNIKLDIGNDIDSKELFDTTLKIMGEIKGKIKNQGQGLESNAKSKTFNFKIAGISDILHALLAKNMGCEQLITFDHDYEEFINLEEFKSLEIIVCGN